MDILNERKLVIEISFNLISENYLMFNLIIFLSILKYGHGRNYLKNAKWISLNENYIKASSS